MIENMKPSLEEQLARRLEELKIDNEHCGCPVWSYSELMKEFIRQMEWARRNCNGYDMYADCPLTIAPRNWRPV